MIIQAYSTGGDSGNASGAFEFTYTGSYVDNRDESGKGVVRLNSSGVLTVLSGAATVIAFLQAGGGGAAFNTGYKSYSYTGGGGGYDTVEVALEVGAYEIEIGIGGAAKRTTESTTITIAGDGGDTVAFGQHMLGGGGARYDMEGRYVGAAGHPNAKKGNAGSNAINTTTAGGIPNGGHIVTQSSQYSATPYAGGDGYIELTFS